MVEEKKTAEKEKTIEEKYKTAESFLTCSKCGTKWHNSVLPVCPKCG